MHKGQLKSWKDDKGFGFIQSSDLTQDTFIHISSLKGMSRKPKTGDFIYFEVEKQANGKTKAINCRIEGVAAKTIQRHKPRIHRNTSSPKNKLVLILMVIGIGAFAFQRLSLSTASTPAQHIPNTTAPSGSLLNRAFSDTNSNFSCDGRQHCSQMTSRAEAVYFIKHCPNTKMDGDRDGIPCENDSRF
ncbi:MAG: cold-shock protein [Gammaproteobacteria bacterium]|nr:MAG: cold-shock protein [Gammaproteobacteria bacterium]PHR84852.1 MAG: cold-shock protein [Colwellia sp.]